MTVDVEFPYLAEVVFANFSSLKFLFSPLSIFYSLEARSHYAQPTLQSREIYFSTFSFKSSALNFLTEPDLVSFLLYHFDFLNIHLYKCPVLVVSTFPHLVQLFHSNGFSIFSFPQEAPKGVTLDLAPLLSSKHGYLCNIKLWNITVKPSPNCTVHFLSFISTNSFSNCCVVQSWKLRVISNLSCLYLIL